MPPFANGRWPRRGIYRYNPDCDCEVCAKGGEISPDDPSCGHSFCYANPHVPPPDEEEE